MATELSHYQFPTAKLAVPSQLRPATRTAILVSCGSYNPIHSAHVSMMHEAKRALEAATWQVAGAFISPVNDAYGKEGLAPFLLRAGICDVMLEGDDFVDVDRWEGLQDAYVRSYFVLCHVRDAVVAHYRETIPASDIDVFLVCGGDLFETFYRPNCWRISLLKKIFDEFRLAVAVRAGSKNPLTVIEESTEPITSTQEPGESLDLKPYAPKVSVFELLPNETSSTMIRQLMQKGEDVPDSLLPRRVTDALLSSNVYPRAAQR